MMQMRNIIFISAFIAVLVCVGITLINTNEKIDKTTLKQDFAALSSYANETEFITKQYQYGKLTFPYVKTQIQYLNRKTLGLLTQLAETTIPDSYKNDVTKLRTNIVLLSQQQSAITSSQGKNKTFTRELSEIKNIEKTLESVQKHYE
jgi:hypothetical protein